MTDTWVTLSGERVYGARKRAGITQAEVATELTRRNTPRPDGYRITQPMVSNVERGEHGAWAEPFATALAAVLGVGLSEILAPSKEDDLPARAEQAAKLLSEAQALLRGEQIVKDQQDQN